MASFDPTPEQQMLVAAVHQFAAEYLRPAARAADETGQLPPEALDTGWALGLLTGSIPEQYGGAGERSALASALAYEELGWGDLSAALAVLAPGLLALPVLLAGSAAQKQAWLPRFCQEASPPVTAALVEPRVDFDPMNLAATARREADGWRLDGQKCFVPLAVQAEAVLVFAALDGDTQGFIVPRGTPGLEIGEREQNMGLRALPTYAVRLAACQVACESRLGDAGGHPFAPILAGAQTALAALAVGVGRAAYEYALAYAKEREAFGEPIARRQSIAFMLAEMATEIEAARLMAWEAAWLIDQGHEAGHAACLARITAEDSALMCADRAVQILGGHGYIRDHPAEMWLRNARGFPMFDGLAML